MTLTAEIDVEAIGCCCAACACWTCAPAGADADACCALPAHAAMLLLDSPCLRDSRESPREYGSEWQLWVSESECLRAAEAWAVRGESGVLGACPVRLLERLGPRCRAEN